MRLCTPIMPHTASSERAAAVFTCICALQPKQAPHFDHACLESLTSTDHAPCYGPVNKEASHDHTRPTPHTHTHTLTQSGRTCLPRRGSSRGVQRQGLDGRGAAAAIHLPCSQLQARQPAMAATHPGTTRRVCVDCPATTCDLPQFGVLWCRWMLDAALQAVCMPSPRPEHDFLPRRQRCPSCL